MPLRPRQGWPRCAEILAGAGGARAGVAAARPAMVAYVRSRHVFPVWALAGDDGVGPLLLLAGRRRRQRRTVPVVGTTALDRCCRWPAAANSGVGPLLSLAAGAEGGGRRLLPRARWR